MERTSKRTDEGPIRD